MAKAGGVPIDKPIKEKIDNTVKQIQHFTLKIGKAQAELDAIVADGTITPEEQERYDELTEEIGNWSTHIDRLMEPKP